MPLALAAMLTASLVGCDGDTPSAAPQPPTATTAVAHAVRGHLRTARLVEILHRQQGALDKGDVRGYQATWSRAVPATRRRGRTIAANLRSLRVHDVAFRLVPPNRGETAATTSTWEPGRSSWTRDVEMTWSLGGTKGRDVRSRLTYTFDESSGQVYVRDISAAEGAREPIWLQGRLEVRRGARTMAAGPTGAGVSGLLRRLRVARRDVREVFPDWRGTLSAYVPATVSQFRRVLGTTSGQYDDIAAVTTTLDGSTSARSPVAIVVNPKVWPRLRPVGAAVVLVHEATHAASGSVTAQLPLWVTEGFADYVAIRAAHVRVSIASAAALRLVRARGAPRRLPDDRAFATTNPRLESTYELSRLAMQTVVRHHGLRRLVSFYRDAVARSDVTGALRRDVGTSQRALTRQWRRLLVRLAGAR